MKRLDLMYNHVLLSTYKVYLAADSLPPQVAGWDAIVTAPSHVHLFCWRSMKPLLEEVAASDKDSTQAGKKSESKA
jgi:hypothetical protein